MKLLDLLLLSFTWTPTSPFTWFPPGGGARRFITLEAAAARGDDGGEPSRTATESGTGASSLGSSSPSTTTTTTTTTTVLAAHREIVSAMHQAVHERTRRWHACERAARRMEQHLEAHAGDGLVPAPREWTVYIAAWGAAQRPDKALAVLAEAEAEMARREREAGAAAGAGQQQREPPEEIRPKAVYGAAVAACCQGGRLEDALRLLDAMRARGCPPDAREWGAVLSALCSSSGSGSGSGSGATNSRQQPRQHQHQRQHRHQGPRVPASSSSSDPDAGLRLARRALQSALERGELSPDDSVVHTTNFAIILNSEAAATSAAGALRVSLRRCGRCGGRRCWRRTRVSARSWRRAPGSSEGGGV